MIRVPDDVDNLDIGDIDLGDINVDPKTKKDTPNN